jgi:hypothetical protein
VESPLCQALAACAAALLSCTPAQVRRAGLARARCRGAGATAAPAGRRARRWVRTLPIAYQPPTRPRLPAPPAPATGHAARRRGARRHWLVAARPHAGRPRSGRRGGGRDRGRGARVGGRAHGGRRGVKGAPVTSAWTPFAALTTKGLKRPQPRPAKRQSEQGRWQKAAAAKQRRTAAGQGSDVSGAPRRRGHTDRPPPRPSCSLVPCDTHPAPNKRARKRG